MSKNLIRQDLAKLWAGEPISMSFEVFRSLLCVKGTSRTASILVYLPGTSVRTVLPIIKVSSDFDNEVVTVRKALPKDVL